jgi:putative transposase
MKRKRHTQSQIIAILKEHEAGMKTADLCRKHGVSEATFYNWKAKYGGLEVSEAKWLRTLESENAKLKKLTLVARLRGRPVHRWPTPCASSSWSTIAHVNAWHSSPTRRSRAFGSPANSTGC